MPRLCDSRNHVAVVVPSLTRAGAERVAETLAREFARTSKVTVVTMEPRLSARQLQTASVLPWAERVPPGCHHVHLPSSGSGISRLAPLVVRFAVLAQRQKFDAVYSFLTWTNVLVAAASIFPGRMLGRRYLHIASEHAMAESLGSAGARLASVARILPLIYRVPDWIVVVSDAARRSLSAAGVLPRPERVVTIPNPVSISEIRSLADATLATPHPPSRPLIACFARLHAQKDHLTLLRALRLLPPSFVLALAGDGPLQAELRSKVNTMGLADRVMFLGILPNPYPLMSQADVVVLPSREEGFGLVAVEAAVVGVPFVGSDTGGLREVCDALGHRTFPVGNAKALAAAVVEASAEPMLSASKLELALGQFGVSRIAEIYLRLGSAPRSRRRSKHKSRSKLSRHAEPDTGIKCSTNA